MKKLVLKLGLTTLAILPVVAVASCSSTTEQSALTTEVNKYKTQFTAKDTAQTMTPTAAAQSINSAANVADKLVALEKLVTLPLNNNSFKYEVGNAESGTGNTINVQFKIIEKANESSSQSITLVIKGFASSASALETEAARFAISKELKTSLNGTISTTQAIKNINETATTQETKLAAINALVDNFPVVGSAFTLTIGQATQDEVVNTSVDIALTITETNTNDQSVVSFTITGLVSQISQEQIQSLANTNLVNKEVLASKAGETAAQAAQAITNLETLGQYYTLATLPQGLKYVYTSDTAEGDTVKIVASVSSSIADSDTTPVSKEFIISGFKSEALVALEAEAALLVNQQTAIANQTASQARAAINSDPTLTSYYRTITLGEAYGYNYGGKSEVDKTDPTRLNVTIRVRVKDGDLAIFKVVQITGFNEPTPIEQEALRFETSMTAKTSSTLAVGVISVLNAIGEDQNQKLTALKGYVDNFPTVGDTYTLSIGESILDAVTPTLVNVPITISPKASTPANANAAETTPVTVIFTITGLTVGSPEEQLTTISKLFNNRTVLEGKKTQTASQAKAAINSDPTLNMYYQNTIMPPQFSYFYGGKTEVNKEDPTTLNVTLRIVNKVVNPNIIMFKVVQITGFTAPTELEKEAQKFATSLPAKVTDPVTTTASVITAINATATTQTAKLTALQGFVANFPATEGYTLEIGTAEIDPTDPTQVLVPITVARSTAGENANENSPVSVTFTITNLTVVE